MARSIQAALGVMTVAEGNLFVVPAASALGVKFFRLVNTTAAQVRINLSVMDAEGNSTPLVPVDAIIDPNCAVDVLGEELLLQGNEKVRGSCSVENAVKYRISGEA